MVLLPRPLVPKARKHGGYFSLGLCDWKTQISHHPQPRRSPLEDLATALVHLKAAAAEGLVQKRYAVHLQPSGHVEDPCGGKQLEGLAREPTLSS